MGSFFNKVLKYSLVAVGTYGVIKLYSIGKSIARISKTLPEFVKNLYGESPKFSLEYNNIIYLKVKLGFPKSILEDNTDIEETVIEYIQDFYPALSKCKISVDVYELESADDDESENVEEKNENENESNDENLTENIKEEVKDEVITEEVDDASAEEDIDSENKDDKE